MGYDGEWETRTSMGGCVHQGYRGTWGTKPLPDATARHAGAHAVCRHDVLPRTHAYPTAPLSSQFLYLFDASQWESAKIMTSVYTGCGLTG